MESFLTKIKLIDSFSVELKTTKSVFTSTLKSYVDYANIDGFFSSAFEAFSSSKNKYKGVVSYNGFKLRKRVKFFEFNIGKAKAIGRLKEKKDSLIIDTKISGWNNQMKFYYGFIIVFYPIVFLIVLKGFFSSNSEFLAQLIFIIFHALLMFGIPYTFMRFSVSQLRKDLEREFYSIINKTQA